MNRTTTLIVLAIFATGANTLASNAHGQIDLGRMLHNELRQGAQQFQGQLRSAIQQGQHYTVPPQGRPQILPYPYPPQQPTPVETYPQIVPPYPGSSVCPSLPSQPIVGAPRILPNPTKSTPVVSQPATEPIEPEPTPLPIVESGQVVSIDGEAFGDEPGVVFVKIGEMILATELVSWTDTVVEARLPSLPLADSVQGLIAVVDAQENVVERLGVNFSPASDNENDEQTDEVVDALPQVEMGTQLELTGEAMGQQQGRVELLVGEITLRATIVKWSDTEATVKLPSMELKQPAEGRIRIIQAGGEINSEIPVQFVAATSVAAQQ